MSRNLERERARRAAARDYLRRRARNESRSVQKPLHGKKLKDYRYSKFGAGAPHRDRWSTDDFLFDRDL